MTKLRAYNVRIAVSISQAQTRNMYKIEKKQKTFKNNAKDEVWNHMFNWKMQKKGGGN